MLALIISVLLTQLSEVGSCGYIVNSYDEEVLHYKWNEIESTYLFIDTVCYYSDTLIVYTSSDFETLLIKNSENEILMNIDLTELE